MAAEGEPAARARGPAARSDRLAAVAIFLVSALYLRYALTFQPPRFRSESLGPATFPLLIAGLMLVCSTLLFVQALRAAKTEEPAGIYLPPLLLWAALLGYVLVFDGLGFPLSTALFLLAGLALMRVRPWWKVLLYAALFTAGLYAAFTGLDVRLPHGEWLRR